MSSALEPLLVGSSYRTRSGLVVTILREEDEFGTVLGSDLVWRLNTGTRPGRLRFSLEDSQDDLLPAPSVASPTAEL